MPAGKGSECLTLRRIRLTSLILQTLVMRR